MKEQDRTSREQEPNPSFIATRIYFSEVGLGTNLELPPMVEILALKQIGTPIFLGEDQGYEVQLHDGFSLESVSSEQVIISPEGEKVGRVLEWGTVLIKGKKFPDTKEIVESAIDTDQTN